MPAEPDLTTARADADVPIADREQFIRENAVALVRRLEDKIAAQRAHCKKVERQVQNFRDYQKMIGADNSRLAAENAKLRAASDPHRAANQTLADRVAELERACKRLMETGCAGDSDYGETIWDQAYAQADAALSASPPFPSRAELVDALRPFAHLANTPQWYLWAEACTAAALVAKADEKPE